MAYDVSKLEKESIKAIKKHNLIFIEDVVCYLECSKATFYHYKLNELDSIKDLILINKVNIKSGLRSKWYEGENASTQIALYKLAATQSELDRLTINKTDHTTGGEKIKSITPIQWINEESED